jgi:hypothetical protein
MFTINIQAQTIEELRRKVSDLSSAISTISNAVMVADEPPVAEEATPVTPPKTRKKKEPEHISVEDLQALCVATAAEVGSPAVKAMISSYSTGGIKAMTDEQRDELAAKLSNRHE